MASSSATRSRPARQPVAFSFPDEVADGPPRKKHTRSSIDSSLAHQSSSSRKRPPSSGSPLNPQNARYGQSSVAYGKRRADTVQEDVSIMDDGMDIFLDPINSDSVRDARVRELQRRAREIGPAPLPHKPPRSPTKPPQTSNTSPRSLESPRPRHSLDSSAAYASRVHSQSPTPDRRPTSPPAQPSSSRTLHPPTATLDLVRSRSPITPPQIITPLPKDPSPTSNVVHRKQTKHSISNLFEDLKRKGKGKERHDGDDTLEQTAQVAQTEERIAEIRKSLPQNDPMFMQRVKTTADQLGRRYSLVYSALDSGHSPPNLLNVIRWRKRILHPQIPVNKTRLDDSQADKNTSSFDVPIVITENETVDYIPRPLYSPSEIESLSWVKGLNTLYLPGASADYPLASGKRMKEWHLTAGVVENYTHAMERSTADGAGGIGPVLYDSPRGSMESRSSHPASEGRLSARPIRSSPQSHRNPPTISPSHSLDIRSVSGGSDRSADSRMLHRILDGTASAPKTSSGASPLGNRGRSEQQSVMSPDPSVNLASPTLQETGAGVSESRSRRSSIDHAFGGDEAPVSKEKPRKRIRNSLPGIIDSSRQSISQFLSPLSASAGHTPVMSSNWRLERQRVLAPFSERSREDLNATFTSTHSDGESGSTSLSDHPMSPVHSTSEDARASRSHDTVVDKMKRRVIGDVLIRKGATMTSPTKTPPANGGVNPTRGQSLPESPRSNRVAPADSYDRSSSDDEMSMKVGLGITRAGRKVAKSWNALTKRDVRDGLYEERAAQMASLGLGEPSSRPSSRPASRPDRETAHDSDTGLLAGTRSDQRLRAGKRIVPVRSRAATQENEEAREARKRDQEAKEQAAYEQRRSLVLTTNRQSEAVNHILQIAVRAVADYATRQAGLADSLGIHVRPGFSPDILDIIEPLTASLKGGWRAVEEDHANRGWRNGVLNDYLRAMTVPDLNPLPTEGSEMAIVHNIFEQIRDIEEHGIELEAEMHRVKDIQDALRLDLDNTEIKFNQTADKINTTYPELSRSEALSRILEPDNVHDLFPAFIPGWVRTYLIYLSSWVRVLADFILMVTSFVAWTVRPLPDPVKDLIWDSFVTFCKTIFNCIVTTYRLFSSINRTVSESELGKVLTAILGPLCRHPWHTLGALGGTWVVYSYTLDTGLLSSIVVSHSTTTST
ncbi:hypothetical protein FRB97_007334 [Tulasnella sp. 331]|nr:hypothetical protein FRB97_007334 [Tulasnella sp. 331]